MRRGLLRNSRIAVSLIFLVAASFLFVDFAGILSPSLINGVSSIQFVPSFLSFLNLFGFLTLGFLAVLLVTFLFGRIYCSTVCPLGILQDVISRLSGFYQAKIRKRRVRFRPARPKNLLRYSLLAITVLFFVSGSLFFLNLLDPFSLFGKIFAGLVRPVYYWLNNLGADLLQSFGIFTLYHVETRRMTLLPLIFPAAMLALILALSFTRGRLYCNTICPVGALLGLVSKVSLYRIQINDSLCTHCAQCSLNCKAQCIDLKRNEIDFSRCVGCFNCLNVCSAQGIGYKRQWFSPAKPSKEIPGKAASIHSSGPRFSPGRRGFLFSLTACFSGFSGFPATSRLLAETSRRDGDIRDAPGIITTRSSTIPEKKEFPVSPPGSLELKHFTGSCTACQLCVSACPTKVLQPSFLEYGFFGMMQPRLDFHAGFCRFDCVTCSEICPTGAILPLDLARKHVTRIGMVRLELDNCVVQTEGTACGACAEHCPTQAVKMVPYKEGLTIPELSTDFCIGCGACEYICPTRPYRAIYIDGEESHTEATPPVVEPLDYAPPEDDFPF